MELQNFLQAMEDLIYEISIWPAMIVKTPYHFSFRPSRIYWYVTEELNKPPGERYDGFLSPVVFWLLVGIVPWFVAAEMLLARPKSSEWHHLYSHAPVEYRFIAIVLFALGIPLAYALGSLFATH